MKLTIFLLLVLPIWANASTGAMISANLINNINTANYIANNRTDDTPVTRKIKFVSYQYIGNNLIAKFYDFKVKKYYTQVGCPSIQNKIGRTYYVSYNYSRYGINCSNFGESK